MTVAEYLDSKSALRYAIRDSLKTRFSDGELLTHLNEAIRKVARDTRYFKGFSLLQVKAYKNTYKLDYRVLKVLSAFTEGCKLEIRGATVACDYTSENTIDFVSIAKETRAITITPTLTNPLYEPTNFDRIIVENDLNGIDDLGIPLHIDEHGNVSPIIGMSADYKEVALYTEYMPVLKLDGEVPDTVLDMAELINIATVVIVTANSSVRETQNIHSQAYNRYNISKREFKKVANDKHLSAEYNTTFRTPFTRAPKSRRRDF